MFGKQHNNSSTLTMVRELKTTHQSLKGRKEIFNLGQFFMKKVDVGIDSCCQLD
jgi:hypothetical protein